MGDLRSPYIAVGKDQILATPSAPSLEAIDSALRPNNAQGQPPQPGIQKDEKFSAWDVRATEILIVNRLTMNEKFERAQNQQERDELWDEILNHLLAAGYSFARIDLMQYWEYEFYIYKSNINSLSVGAQAVSNWKYFEIMDSVFKCSVEATQSKSPREAAFALVRDGLLSEPTDSGVYDGVKSEPVITSQPKEVLIPAKNKGVVTTQPRSTAYRYTSAGAVAPSSNRYDSNDDDTCSCCWCCCDDCCIDYPNEYSGRRTGYTTRTGGANGRSSEPIRRTGGYNGISRGYTSHKSNYNTVDFTADDYSDRYTNNYTKVHIFDNNHYINGDNNGDNNGDSNGDIIGDNCGDSSREDGRGTNNGCCCDTDSGGTNNGYCGNGGGDTGNDGDTAGGDTVSSADNTNRDNTSGAGDTDFGYYDAGGSDADYGGGYTDYGGDYADYGDGGDGDDGGGDDGGGGDD